VSGGQAVGVIVTFIRSNRSTWRTCGNLKQKK